MVQGSLALHKEHKAGRVESATVEAPGGPFRGTNRRCYSRMTVGVFTCCRP